MSGDALHALAALVAMADCGGDSQRRAVDGFAAVIRARLAAALAAPVESDREALAAAREALPEFRQQDDYLLSPGASLMSEESHEIIHLDTLRRALAAARLAASAPAPLTGELPPLPSPDIGFPWRMNAKGHTADQMRAYAKSAIESAVRAAALPQEPPKGWRLAPTKVTNAMIDAANAVPSGIAGSPPHWQWVWDAMLAAAPSAPATAALPQEPPRFFMDHGLWHDRETGQHLYTQDQYDANRGPDWQQRCLDAGFKYWRAPDAHGVTATVEQATALLQDLLGVEVEIAAPSAPATPPAQPEQLSQWCLGPDGKPEDMGAPPPPEPPPTRLPLVLSVADVRLLHAVAAVARRQERRPEAARLAGITRTLEVQAAAAERDGAATIEVRKS